MNSLKDLNLQLEKFKMTQIALLTSDTFVRPKQEPPVLPTQDIDKMDLEDKI